MIVVTVTFVITALICIGLQYIIKENKDESISLLFQMISTKLIRVVGSDRSSRPVFCNVPNALVIQCYCYGFGWIDIAPSSITDDYHYPRTIYFDWLDTRILVRHTKTWKLA